MTERPVTAGIPITRPVFGPEELAALAEPLETGWVVQGPLVRRFEERFASFIGARHALATTSCTTALHLAVAALALKQGDEVIVPALTWVSTANVVEYQGARPVFCDVDLRTFNLDPARLADLITPRTVGIIAVHLFGLCADMEPILEIARAHGLWVVEDAACGFGAWYHGRHAGTFGDAGCFSFHARKSITTGEGGMLTTQREDLASVSRSLRDHGASRSDLERHQSRTSFLLPDFEHVGYNYRMTDLQGAVGCAQMDRASWILDQRSRHAARYDELLEGLDWLDRPVTPPGYVHGYQAYVCLFRPEAPTLANSERLSSLRNSVMVKLEEKRIATRPGTHAPVTLGFYAKKYALRAEDYPRAVVAERLSLTLPLFAQMTDDEQHAVVDALKEAWSA